MIICLYINMGCMNWVSVLNLGPCTNSVCVKGVEREQCSVGVEKRGVSWKFQLLKWDSVVQAYKPEKHVSSKSVCLLWQLFVIKKFQNHSLCYESYLKWWQNNAKKGSNDAVWSFKQKTSVEFNYRLNTHHYPWLFLFVYECGYLCICPLSIMEHCMFYRTYTLFSPIKASNKDRSLWESIHKRS